MFETSIVWSCGIGVRMRKGRKGEVVSAGVFERKGGFEASDA